MVPGRRRQILWPLVLLAAALAAGQAGASVYDLSYGGRLTQPSGAPVAGPVSLDVKFFRSSTGADLVPVALAPFEGVALQNGLFQLAIDLAPSDFHALFNGADEVWVEVSTNGTAQPRQRFSAVPYALKVPVDGTTIGYDGNGQLTYVGSPGVSVVTATAPVAIGGSATAPVVSLPQADAGNAGYLAAADWTTFNTKQAALGFAPVNKAGDTLTGALTVLTPTAPGHATTKSYVDAMLGGFTLDQTAKLDQYVVKWDQTAGKFVLGADQLGAAGGGIQSINALSATAQTIVLGTAGTAPAWTSATTTHTLDLPLAAVAGVTAGLVAKTDYDTFMAKQPAITAASTVSAGTLTTTLQNGVELKPYGAAAGNTGELRLDELAANGASYVALKAPDALAATIALTLPNADGTSGQVLTTNGAGLLSWSSHPTVPASTTTVAEGSNLYFTDARARTAISATAPLSYVSGTGVLSLANTAVVAGAYTRANVTVDAQGRLTAASNGASVNLASEVTGTLPVANGGTGATSAAANLVFASPNGSAGAPAFRALTATDVPTLTAAKISDFTAATNAAEADPQVATLTANKWCVANAGATAVDCATNAPVLTESDPEVGANTTNYLSKWSGTALVAGSVFDNGTNVGVGTGSPGYKLDVNGNARVGTNLGVGGIPATNVGVYVSGTTLSTANQFGIDVNVTYGSDATTRAASFYSAPLTTAATYTVPDLYHYYGGNVALGAGSAVTNQYGLYVAYLSSAANNYAVYTAGSTKSYFGGSVGLGTTSPDAKLDVASDGDSQMAVTTYNSAAANNMSYLFLDRGRGTHASRASVADGDFLSRISSRAYNAAGPRDATMIESIVDGVPGATYVPGALLFETATATASPAERMRVTSAGDVGIGTTTPKGRLEVDGNAVVKWPGNTAASRYIGQRGLQTPWVGADTGFAGMEIESAADASNSDQALHFYTHDGGISNNRRLTIDKSGSVGIGTTAPILKLDVAGGGIFRLSTADEIDLHVRNSAGGMYIYVLPDGRPGYARVNAAGTYASSLFYATSTNASIGDTTFTGCIYYNNGASSLGTCSSDERLKKNIQPIAGALRRLSLLRPVTFEYRKDEFPSRGFAEGLITGLVAQDVEQVWPELVSTDVEGFKRVNYGIELQMHTIAALQEFAAEKDAKIEELEGRLDALTDYLCVQDPAAPICSATPANASP